MRINIEIDDTLMSEAQLVTGLRTKGATVDLALRELVARYKQLGILDLGGKIPWEGDLNSLRRGRYGRIS